MPGVKAYRLLNDLEEYHYNFNATGSYTSFVLGVKLSQDVRDNMNSFRACLRALINKRKILRLQVFQEKNKLYCAEITDVDIGSVFELYDGNYSEELLAKMHGNGFKYGVKQYLWHLKITRDNYLLLNGDHTFIDGSTGCSIMEELVCLLNGYDIVPDSDEYKSLEKITKVSKKFALKTLWELHAPLSLQMIFRRGKSRPHSLVGGKCWTLYCEPPLPNPSFSSIKRKIYLDKNQICRLKSLIRNHNVKFTSYLIYAILSSFYTITDNPIRGSVAVDLRKYLNHQTKTYGVYVSALFLQLSPPTTKDIDWNYVSHINGLMNDDNLRQCAKLIGILKYVYSKKLFETMKKQPRRDLFEVSNLGVRPDFKDEKWSVLDHVFSQPGSPIAPFVTHDIISTSEQIQINLNFDKEFLPFLDQYFQKFRDFFDFRETNQQIRQ